MIKESISSLGHALPGDQVRFSRKTIVAIILGVALVAFEIFNFDTTQFALRNLLGDVQFMGLMWASILAIAFCAIDFAGLVRLYTPERGREEPRAIWFLTGAWFLGTIANAIMTWWAVSLTLLGHEFGNEVLSREALLRYVPIFVAILVWLTRILFIGAFAVAGEDIMEAKRAKPEKRPDENKLPAVAALPSGKPAPAPARTDASAFAVPAGSAGRPAATQRSTARPPAPQPQLSYEALDEPITTAGPATPKTTNGGAPQRGTSRIHQKPPTPGGSGRIPSPGNIQARPTGNEAPRS